MIYQSEQKRKSHQQTFVFRILGLSLFFSFLLFLFFAPIFKAYSFDDTSYPLYEEPVHKQDLSIYINQFCTGKGKPNAIIQGKIKVDCLTHETLWKVDYADNWNKAFIEALDYGIYDDYQGDERYAPTPGVVLVNEDADDYKNMIQLRQLVKFYRLPVQLQVLENFGNGSPAAEENKFAAPFIKIKSLFDKPVNP